VKRLWLWVRYWWRHRRWARGALHVALLAIPTFMIAVLLSPWLQARLSESGLPTPQTMRWQASGRICPDETCTKGLPGKVYVGGYSAISDANGDFSLRFSSVRLDDTVLTCVSGTRIGLVHLVLEREQRPQVICLAAEDGVGVRP
jgi:hypothetical protein